MEEVKVCLTYFKESGKYYSSGEFMLASSGPLHMGIVATHVRSLMDRKELPGLCKDHSDFHVLIGSEALGFPHLLVNPSLVSVTRSALKACSHGLFNCHVCRWYEGRDHKG